MRINKIWLLSIPFFIRAPQRSTTTKQTNKQTTKQTNQNPTVFCATITHKLLRKIPHYNGLKRVTAGLIHLPPCPTVATWQLCQKRERGVRGSSTVCVTLGVNSPQSPVFIVKCWFSLEQCGTFITLAYSIPFKVTSNVVLSCTRIQTNTCT